MEASIFFVDVNVQEWKVAFFYFFHCKLYLVVDFIEVVQKFHVGRYPPQTVSVVGPTSSLSSSFLLAQAIFEPNLFPYKYSNILKPTHSSYLSAYEDGTDIHQKCLATT